MPEVTLNNEQVRYYIGTPVALFHPRIGFHVEGILGLRFGQASVDGINWYPVESCRIVPLSQS